MKFSTILALGAALTLAAPAAFCEAATPAAATVIIKNFDFSPMTVTIPVGGRVVWTNKDGEIHTVTSVDGAFRSGGLDQNDSFTFRFAKPGTYLYVCSVHPQMKARVIVR